MESADTQIHQHIKSPNRTDTQYMNLTDYSIEEPNKEVVTSQHEYEIANRFYHIQSFDNESTLVAAESLKSSISPEHTMEVC